MGKLSLQYHDIACMMVCRQRTKRVESRYSSHGHGLSQNNHTMRNVEGVASFIPSLSRPCYFEK